MDESPDRGTKRNSSHEAPTSLRAADDKHTERDRSSRSETSMRNLSASRHSVERRLGRKHECGKGANFVVESTSFPRLEGCYQPLSQYNGEAMYRQSRDCASCNYVVGATQGDIKDSHDVSCRVSMVGIFPPSRNPATKEKGVHTTSEVPCKAPEDERNQNMQDLEIIA